MQAMKSLAKRTSNGTDGALNGKTDLLLRFFESQFFDEWIALMYMYQNNQPGVQDYLCNKLYELPSEARERYLLQFVYLAVSRPGSPLERTIIDLCHKSFQVAIKVYWLLLALVQDNPRHKLIENFKDACEKAALEGKWEVPFQDPHLDPLSPGFGNPPFSPDWAHSHAAISGRPPPPPSVLRPLPATTFPNGAVSPTLQAPRRMSMGSSPPAPESISSALAALQKSVSAKLQSLGSSSAREEPLPRPPGPLHIDLNCLPSIEQRGLSLTMLQNSGPAEAPAATGPQTSAGANLPGMLAALPAKVPHLERYDMLRKQLGEGEGVTALLEKSKGGHVLVSADEVLSDDDMDRHGGPPSRPLSPTTRLRHDTFGATVQFIEALCDASATLASVPQDERQRALRMGLESINREIENANRRDIAIWFPMAARQGKHERVLRLASRDAVLLNSREKAPFMLFVEVLEEEDEDDVSSKVAAGATTVADKVTPAGPNQLASEPVGDLLHCNDSALSLKSDSHGSRRGVDDSAFASSNANEESRSISPEMGPGSPVVFASQSALAVAAAAVSSGSNSGPGASAAPFPPSPRFGDRLVPSSGSALQPATPIDIPTGSSVTSRISSAPPSCSLTLGQGVSLCRDRSTASSGGHEEGPRRGSEAPSTSSLSFSTTVGTVAGLATGLASGVARSLCFVPNVGEGSSPVEPGKLALEPAVAAAPKREKAALPVPSGQQGFGGGHTAVAAANGRLVRDPGAPVMLADVTNAGEAAKQHAGSQLLPRKACLGKRADTVKLTDEELNELISSGCMSPPAKSDAHLASKMAGVMASLRGEAPLVRVHIQVLEPKKTLTPPPSASLAVSAVDEARRRSAGEAGPGPSTQQTAGLASSFLSSLAKRAGSAGAGASPATPPLYGASSSGTTAASAAAAAAAADGDGSLLGGSRTILFLAKLGLCRHVGPEEDKEAAAAAAATAAAAQQQPERLVSLRIDVATSNINLNITSPYRKSRRMPSHEAINFIAEKYKVHSMPPPCQSGPPLMPPPADDRQQGPAHMLSGIVSPVAEGPHEGLLSPTGAALVLSPGLLSPRNSSASAPPSAPPVPARDATVVAAAQDHRWLDAVSSQLRGLLTPNPPKPPLAAPAPSLPPIAVAASAAAAAAGGATAPGSSLAPLSVVRPAPVTSAGSAGVTTAAAGTPTLLPPQGTTLADAAAAAAAVGDSNSARWRSGDDAAAAMAAMSAATASATVTPAPSGTLEPALSLGRPVESLAQRRRREAAAVYGERWEAKARRIQAESPQGRRKGWALRCAIVKSGDDCRQELLAMQLIRTFYGIFQLSELPLYVRPYEVLVTSNKTALIELVPDSLSIHTLKSRSPPNTSFSEHFFAKFGRGTPECLAAQRKFTESLAAYSIINYMLQIKDRHNGNVLVDDEGHIVHIDFGFMLSNSPGGVNFETAPFKLTRELLEVMDSNSEGRPSEMFDYFKVLVIQGFLACRKYHDRILLLVRIMAKSNFPCFKGGERAVKALEKRFQLSMTEVQCVQHVLSLISDSLDAWRTRQYDYYQRVLNGIL